MIQEVILNHAYPYSLEPVVIIIIQTFVRLAPNQGGKIKTALVAAEKEILCPLLAVFSREQ